jgi:Helix-turn-helix domain
MTSTPFETFNWMRAVSADKGVIHLHRLVLLRLVLYRNGAGRCDPAYDTLASELGVDRRTVIRSVAAGVSRGWLVQPVRRGPNSNSFAFSFPTDWRSSRQDVTPQSHQEALDETVESHQGVEDVTPQSKRCDSPVQKIGLPRHPNGIKNGRRERGKSKTRSPGDAPREKKAPARKRPKVGDTDESFAAFWAAYPRKCAKEAARKAFAKAIKAGVDPATLIAGVKRYAIERLNQDPQYTAYPATWLNGHYWENEPAGTTVIDQHGNILAVEQPQRRNGGQKTWDEVIAEKMAEAGDGPLH